ncbi:probable E3 ubiquitin-protein ligase EDA40 [Rutidosis leptorrhynchoides]|uniref:probable E3 ubiquitin-protein ligase EDA40 n=1 Tax=Rutidosis leptorrhynchoides TaxID=125765 RepID=UPI003A996211
MMGGAVVTEARRRSTKKQLKTAAWRLFHTCGSFSFRQPQSTTNATAGVTSVSDSGFSSVNHNCNKSNNNINHDNYITKEEDEEEENMVSDPTTTSSSKTMCAICLEALNYSACTTPGQAIFTAQCSHAFHFDCIASNVRHGGVTCPICRAQWTHLPRNLKIPPCSFLYGNQTDDPILQILDDSIATFRVHRRSILRSARYDDDDPIEPSHNHDHDHPRLHLSILTEPLSHQCSSSLSPQPNGPHLYRSCLSVRLAHQPAIDLVLVACPNGPHLRLIKQSMALVVFSLRPIDRLAVVTYSSAAARVFPLRRMTSYGKRAALQVIDRLFYMGQTDPVEGLKKGVKVLMDRSYENPQSCILHLSDNPTRSYHGFDTQVAIQIHRFHVGYSFGTSNGFVMHEFEEFLGRVLGDKIRDLQLRIRDDNRIVRFGELRGGEERRIPLTVNNEDGNVRVEYSYVEDGVRECIRSGEVMVMSAVEKMETDDDDDDDNDNDGVVASDDGRSSNAGNWDYHDPYMARRWAKHLHAYRL